MSTLIEILISVSVIFIQPKAFSIGCLIGLGGMMACFIVGRFIIHNPNAFWRGEFWENYCMSVAERKPTINTLIFEKWVIIAFMAYAFIVKDAFIACGILGIAAAVSSMVLVQSFLEKKNA